jgi:signal transduction histidine kinase/CheY-like chemotaxis protein
MKNLLLIFLFVFFCSNLFAQKFEEKGLFFTTIYTADDYKAANQVWSVIEDKRGIMYFGNNKGILEYDGVNWRTIRVRNNTTVRPLAVDNDGRIYAGAVKEFGFLEPNENGTLMYHSLSQYLPEKYPDFSDVWKINITSEGVYFQSKEALIRFRPEMLKQEKKIEDCFKFWAHENEFFTSAVLNDKLFITIFNEGLHYVDGDSLKRFQRIQNTNSYIKINDATQIEKNKWLLIDFNDGTFLYFPNDSLVKNQNFKLHNANEIVNYSFSKLTRNNFAFGTVRNGLFITDIHGNIIYAIDETKQLSDLMVLDIFLSEKQLLWLGTGNGITKIEYNTPMIRFWSTINGFDGTVQSIIKHQGKIFIGTTVGLFRMRKPDKPGGIEKFEKIEGVAPQIWCLYEFEIEKTGKKILLCGSGANLYSIENGKAEQIFDLNLRVYGTICSLPNQPNLLLLACSDGIKIIKYENDKWNYIGEIPDFKYRVRVISIDSKGFLWISTIYDGVAKIKFNYNPNKKELSKDMFDITMYDTLNGLTCMKNNKIYAIKDEVVYASEKGLYKYNEKTDSFGLKMYLAENQTDESIFLSVLASENGKIWIHNKYILFPDKEDYNIDSTSLKCGLGGRAFYLEDENTYWFGGAKGLFRLNLEVEKNYNAPFHTLIRKVSINDSIIFNGYLFEKNLQDSLFDKTISVTQHEFQIPVLSYNDNSIRFHYAAIFYEREEETEYKYILEGFDNDWSEWLPETKKEYTNLHEGKYTFKVKAKNFYSFESDIAIYEFEILAPWHRTWWAYAGYIILLFFLIWFIVKLYIKQLIKDKEKVEESDRLKTEFIHNMSHEIRTPLNGILGFSEFLSTPNLTERDRKQYINIIHNSGKQLLRIIDDILEISRLETKHVTYRETKVCLNEILLKLYSIFDITAKEQKILLHLKKELTDKESTILTDETKLNTITSNLLENAFKFTNDGYIEFGYCLVETRSNISEQSGVSQQLQIYVKDTGIGIKPDKQETIFKRFSQEDYTTATGFGGLGLGLSIAKEYAELINGKITVKSQKRKGSTFFVTIPYKPANSTDIETIKTQDTFQNTIDEYFVLIVEDEELNYEYLRTLLGHFDLKIKTLYANCGQEAVEICKDNSDIDIVLMDLKMPVMNGFKATKLIKKMCPDLPIIAQTSYSTPEDQRKAKLAGCDDFISKPINKDIIATIINIYLPQNKS